METKFTWGINTFMSLPYLKLAIESIRENAHYKNQPICVYVENDEETAEWIKQQSDITPIIEYNKTPVGIGGGVNKIVEQCKTEFVSIIHSDMYISKHYDAPLFDIVSSTEKPILACAWRLEPNIFGNQDRVGTTFAPPNTEEGFGVYYHDFKKKEFLTWADDFVNCGASGYRKVEGVSYMMRTKYFINNDSRFAPTSYEDMMLNVLMQIKEYDFVVTPKAMVWHFGARSSHFLGQHDKLTGTSNRQKESEQKNFKTWLDLWGEPPHNDDYGFIKVSEQMKQRYKNNPELYDRGC